jgi:hypothetical protein
MDFEQKPTPQSLSEIEKPKRKVSRRYFLKLVGGAVSFVVLNGCGASLIPESDFFC